MNMEDCMKRLFITLVILIMGFMPLMAATVSVLVIETGLPTGKGQSPSASVWESGVMDAFFDAGFIVSNAPCIQLDKPPASHLPVEARRYYEEAILGGADFFVIVHLDYPIQNDASASTVPIKELPKSVSIAVFNISSSELVYQALAGNRNWGTPNEEFLFAKQNTGKIILHLKG
jgi:hypothetical protein